VLQHDEDGAMASSEVFDADGALVALAEMRLIRIPAGSVVANAARDEADRVLATVLFTDIVSSTERATQMGDRDWRELLNRHHTAVREALMRFRGTEVKTTGDGFVATFDSPARAVRCARAIKDSMGRFGVQIRAGLHTAEVEVEEGDITGIAVHIAARVIGKADAGEILVSSTVRDLVAGSDLRFRDRGVHELKGVEGDWRLYALDG
jgi:class 3 adenylate cyclase